MRKSIISVLIMFLLIISSTIAQGDIFVRKIDNSYQIEKRDIIAIIPQLPKNIQFNKETEEKIIELYMGTIKSYVAKTEYTLKVLSIIPLRMERVTGQVKISWIEDNGKPVGEWNIKKLPAITSEALPEKITGNIFLALVMVLLFITTLTNRANLGTKLSRLLIFYVLNILVLLIFISVVKQSAVAEMLSPQGFVVVSMATLAVGLMASLLLVREKKVDNSWAMFTEIFIVGVVVIFSIPGTICSPGNYAAIFALLASSCAVGFILAIPIRRYKLRRLKAVMPFGFQKEL